MILNRVSFRKKMISMSAYFIAEKMNVKQRNKTKRTPSKYFQGYLGVIIKQRACDVQVRYTIFSCTATQK